MMTEANDDMLIDLYKHNFFFAIENLDPRVGTVRLQQVNWPSVGGRTKTDIELVDCVHYQEGGKYEHLVSETQKRLLFKQISRL